jgi:hypothetical protein
MHKLYLFKAKGNLSNKTPNVIITLAEFEVTSKKDCGLVSKNFTSNLWSNFKANLGRILDRLLVEH